MDCLGNPRLFRAGSSQIQSYFPELLMSFCTKYFLKAGKLVGFCSNPKKTIFRTADENLAKVLNFAIKRGKPITASQVLQTFSSLRRVSVETIRGWFLALEAEGKSKTNGKGTRMTFTANRERA